VRGHVVALVLAAACSDTPEPEFPTDYAATYTEVRGCRSSSDHDLHQIRVLADPAALDPYRTRTSAFPVGAVVLKEEFDFADTLCAGPILVWTVMKKTRSAANLGWTWQYVEPASGVGTQNERRCINCHTTCGVGPDGYDGTCTMP